MTAARTSAPPPASASGDPSSIHALITVAASAATALLVVGGASVWGHVVGHPLGVVSFVALTLALQLTAVEVYGRGAVSFAGMGMLSLGMTFGATSAMAVAVLVAAINFAQRRGFLHRAVFDAACLSLAAGAGAGVYRLIAAPGWSPLLQLGPAILGGACFWAVNIGLLSFAMSLAEGTHLLAVWRERFQWITPYYLASGPLALACATAYEKLGVIGLLAFALPPAFMMLSVRQYLRRTRDAVEEIRRTNEELRLANTELAARNDDLSELFTFASGLAAHAHDRTELVGYAEDALGHLLGATASISVGESAGGMGLIVGHRPVGGLELDAGPRFDESRWGRLRDAILPQLATALESSGLVAQVRKTHLATIAALSRSMEAKDLYTGGHTERVSGLALALATRLGYSGPELDAIQIGALLHDIGKIGIPERILHKPGPLETEEWKLMRKHPEISEYILSGVDLPEIVLQIARSSHERIDGFGYPDGLRADEIPLPARIVLVADAFDALTSDRPYRRGRHVDAALEEIRANAGKQFCPVVVDALFGLYREQPHLLSGGQLHALGDAA